MAESPDQSETHGQSDPRVPVVCSACETETRVPIAAVAETLEQHNRRQHDGGDVAEVDPELAEQLADLVAEELGLL